jgi:hypothetical protein
MIGCRNFLMSGTYPTYSYVDMNDSSGSITNSDISQQQTTQQTERMNPNKRRVLSLPVLKLHHHAPRMPISPTHVTGTSLNTSHCLA